MGRMHPLPPPRVRRRQVLLCAAAALAPLPSLGAGVCTPQELAARYEERVQQRLQLPAIEERIYTNLVENELASSKEVLRGPQYLLVVDICPAVQAAFLIWRLLPGSHELVGASPASTGTPLRPGCCETPRGVFPQAGHADPEGALASRIYDFGLHRARVGTGRSFAPLHLQARAARGAFSAQLGRAQSDGSVLLPPTLVAFLHAYGVLDAPRGDGRTPAGELLPFAGRCMVVVDSERDERPDWAVTLNA